MKKISHDKSAETVKYIEEMHAAAGQIKYFDLVLKEGKGALLKDIDDNIYIDFLASASATNIGHSHPRVIEKMTEQMNKLVHYIPAYFYNDTISELLEKLIDFTPGSFKKKILFGNSGSDANDGIIKLARAYTGRQTIVSFQGAYHGNTYGAMTLSATSLNMRRNMQPLVPGVYHMPYPNTYHRPESESDEELTERYWQYFEEGLATYLPSDEIACIIIEPIQGDGGFIKPPKEFMTRLYAFCQQNGIVFAVDEINQGLGRSGKMWSIDHFNIEPDLMSIGKSLASGMPLSAIVGKSEIMESLEAPAHTFTTAANPVCVAASLATLDVIQTENLVEKSRQDGLYIEKFFDKMKKRYDFIGDVRLFGLNGGIEIVKSQESKIKDHEAAAKLITYCYRNGVLMITVAGNVLRIQPPLVIKREEIDEALGVIEDAFIQLEAGNIILDSSRKIGW